MWGRMTNCSHSLLTHYLETAIGEYFSHIPGAEPSLTRLVHKEVLVAVFLPVVAHGHVWPPNQDLSSWVGLVFTGVATCGQTSIHESGVVLSGSTACTDTDGGVVPSTQSLSLISQQIRGAPTRPVLMSATECSGQEYQHLINQITKLSNLILDKKYFKSTVLTSCESVYLIAVIFDPITQRHILLLLRLFSPSVMVPAPQVSVRP